MQTPVPPKKKSLLILTPHHIPGNSAQFYTSEIMYFVKENYSVTAVILFLTMELGVVVHTYNPSTQEDEVGRLQI
jgi:hypothetical protein